MSQVLEMIFHEWMSHNSIYILSIYKSHYEEYCNMYNNWLWFYFCHCFVIRYKIYNLGNCIIIIFLACTMRNKTKVRQDCSFIQRGLVLDEIA